MSHEYYLLTLNTPPSLEEDVVDCLLSTENANSFSSYSVYAHEQGNEHLSIAEQVSGRQRKICFRILIGKKELAILINQLKLEFSGSGLKYSVVPVIEFGEI